MSKPTASPWMSQREARARLGIGLRRLGRLMTEGYIGLRELPAGAPLLSREDVERLAEASTRPARVEMESAGASAV